MIDDNHGREKLYIRNINYAIYIFTIKIEIILFLSCMYDSMSWLFLFNRPNNRKNAWINFLIEASFFYSIDTRMEKINGITMYIIVCFGKFLYLVLFCCTFLYDSVCFDYDSDILYGNLPNRTKSYWIVRNLAETYDDVKWHTFTYQCKRKHTCMYQMNVSICKYFCTETHRDIPKRNETYRNVTTRTETYWNLLTCTKSTKT